MDNSRGHERLQMWVNTITDNGFQVKLINSDSDHKGRDLAEFVVSNHRSNLTVFVVITDLLDTYIRMEGDCYADDVNAISKFLNEK